MSFAKKKIATIKATNPQKNIEELKTICATKGGTGVGFIDDVSYTYRNYTFVDSKNIEYEMKYIYETDSLNLVEGNKYTVDFEVTQDNFGGYNFTIKSIK